jgi:S-DNA-T family DNA segregation ATPase FtsK/SpoIIIE
VVATQRPSVNVITGIIKANFPARWSFKVTSKVDSRTILDTGGAEQLVGMGDTLLSMGSEMIRVQCPFIDTHEVENICEFIGSQRGYESAYLLPEYVEDQSGQEAGEVDIKNLDPMYEEAARIIVINQQGSTSLLQRKLKIGYNRAGRLIDQLEATGVVGPFEGSKDREVLVGDEQSLEQLLKDTLM